MTYADNVGVERAHMYLVKVARIERSLFNKFSPFLPPIYNTDTVTCDLCEAFALRRSYESNGGPSKWRYYTLYQERFNLKVS